jgi:hypothetical protein
VEEALAHWRECFVMEQHNYFVRKQVWAVRNPEKFYDGEVAIGSVSRWGRKPKLPQRPAHGPA